MISFLRANWVTLVILAVVMAAAGPMFFAAYQSSQARRFDFGSLDADYLGGEDTFYGPVMMSGPLRHEDGSVTVIDFYGRLSRHRVGIKLPYHAESSPLRLFLRCHRFGLRGTVSLIVNDEHLDDFVFTETSYPWGGIRTVVPQRVAERGPLRIELVTEGGDAPQRHLPAEVGLGFDYVEVEPMSGGATLRPSRASYAWLYGFVLSGFLFALGAGLSLSSATMVLGALVVVALFATAGLPVESELALSRLWIVFAFALLVYVALVHLLRLGRDESRFVSGLVVVATFFHSVLIFFPNHLPPDVPLHSVQVSRFSSVDFSYRGLIDYSRTLSRGLTSDAVLMDLGDAADPETEVAPSYGAPYPPFFYMLAYGASRVAGELRFTFELLAVLMAALMLVLVYLVARAIWDDEITSRAAALLFSVEISVWHHANRGHAPGIFGALSVLVLLWYLAAHREALRTRGGFVLFTTLSAVVALGYTVSLIQISLFVPVFALLLLLSRSRPSKELVPRMLGSFGVGIAAALLLFYGPYLAEAWTASRSDDVLLSRATSYDPPATFFFFRNLLRDTARILGNGHTLYILLSVVGLVFLRSSSASSYHRRFIWGGVLTYVTILVLKDPAFLPRIFLHAKEDLFYSALACLLGALAVVRLWRASNLGRSLALAGFLALLYLSIRDKSWNVNTLHPQPLAHHIDGTDGGHGRAG